MPTYEYQCNKCDTIVEETRSISEESKIDKCPNDSGQLIRKYNVAVSFKGNGFYTTDKNKKGDN